MPAQRQPAPTLDATALAGAAYGAALEALGLRLPLRRSVEEVGLIVDDDGEDVLTVDVWRDAPDDKVAKITDAVVALVNLAAGYAPVATEDRADPVRWEPGPTVRRPAASAHPATGGAT